MSEPQSRYQVRLSRKVERRVARMPQTMQWRFRQLLMELKERGPMLPDWPNFSKLGPDKYHCHLGYSWVACWTHDKGTVNIEVYYAGSRENAPY